MTLEPVWHVHVCTYVCMAYPGLSMLRRFHPVHGLVYVQCPLILLVWPSTPGEEHPCFEVCLPLTPESATSVWGLKGADWSHLSCFKQGMRSLTLRASMLYLKAESEEGLQGDACQHLPTGFSTQTWQVRGANLRLVDQRGQV